MVAKFGQFLYTTYLVVAGEDVTFKKITLERDENVSSILRNSNLLLW